MSKMITYVPIDGGVMKATGFMAPFASTTNEGKDVVVPVRTATYSFVAGAGVAVGVLTLLAKFGKSPSFLQNAAV